MKSIKRFIIQVYLTEDEKKKIQLEAVKQGKRDSQFLKDIVLKEIEKLEELEELED